MNHIDEGTLRRFVDEPFAASDTQRNHFESCDRCQSTYAQIADTAHAMSALLSDEGDAPNTGQALGRVRARLDTQPTAPGRRARRRLPGFRPATLAGTAALLAGALVWSPAGSWAQNVISVFQPDQVGSIQVTADDLQSLSRLAKYGTVHISNGGSMQRVGSADAAGTSIGMPIAEPSSLPSSVSGTPVFEVSPGEHASFTFNAAMAHNADPSAPAMPPSIDGSTLHVTVQPVALTVYRGTERLPELVIGEMRAPTVTSTGASVGDLETYLLSLPDVPSQVADQIRALQNPSATLPIPIPVDHAHSSDVTVQGVHGVAVGDNTGLAAGVIWERNGVIYGVGGMLSQDQVLAVANSLR